VKVLEREAVLLVEVVTVVKFPREPVMQICCGVPLVAVGVV